MKPHEEWLFKARNDFGSATFLLTSDEPYFDIVVYHAQQCAEKSLEAFLAYSRQEIVKTHSLIVLAEKCFKLSPDFSQILDHISILNPYSTLYRYPLDSLMPTREETNHALKSAQIIWDFVSSKT